MSGQWFGRKNGTKKKKWEKIPVEFTDGTCYSKMDSGAQSTPEAKRPKNAPFRHFFRIVTVSPTL